MTNHSCSNEAEVIVCQHIASDDAAVEVLLVNDEGGVDYALCVHCGAAERPDDLPLQATCRACAAEKYAVPAIMPTPGKWQVGVLLPDEV